jgi:hypothetical protein
MPRRDRRRSERAPDPAYSRLAEAHTELLLSLTWEYSGAPDRLIAAEFDRRTGRRIDPALVAEYRPGGKVHQWKHRDAYPESPSPAAIRRLAAAERAKSLGRKAGERGPSAAAVETLNPGVMDDPTRDVRVWRLAFGGDKRGVGGGVSLT